MIEEKKVEDKKEETSWNIGKIHSYHIASLLQEASLYQRKGDFLTRYITLRTVREMINYALSEAERKELDKMEILGDRNGKKWEEWKDDTKIEVQVSKELYNTAVIFERLVTDYQRKLMDFLRQQGFFPTKTDKRFFKGI